MTINSGVTWLSSFSESPIHVPANCNDTIVTRTSQEFKMIHTHDNFSDGNETMNFFSNVSMNEDYIFDRMDIRIIFITFYSIVFFFCFFECMGFDHDSAMAILVSQIGGRNLWNANLIIPRAIHRSLMVIRLCYSTSRPEASTILIILLQGNVIVILVVLYSRRMRGVTNFFLANLAGADLCVGIFCVYQTLINYLMNSWLLGDFLCKTYMFVHALSYTASIMILVLVCVERYFAIIHPIQCRSMLTRGRLRIIVAVVWMLAAVYASPRFTYVETMQHELNSGTIDIMCIANIKKHNKNVLDTVNLIFLYLIPLFLMSCLYTRIAVALWKSSAAFSGPGLVARTRNGRVHHVHASSRNVLRARRGVVRMLIAVVVMFAICNLPQQARILWLHMDPNYDRSSDFSTIFTVSTFLISYTNSCLNPLLYAFLSRNFRKAMRELFFCHSRNPGNRLGMGYIGGDAMRHENGNTANVPHSSMMRLSSAHDSPCTAQTITRQNTYMKNS